MSRRGVAAAFDAHAALAQPRQRKRCGEEWFWKRVDKTGDCWRWTGRCRLDGYGVVTWCSVDVGTHRLAYSLAHGPIGPGQVVRHKCDNPPCCNPAHLEIGSVEQNNADMRERGRARTDQLVRRGTDNCRSKLNDGMVRELRTAWRAGESIKNIAERTGLAVGTIHPMLHGRTWAHVTDDSVSQAAE